MTSKIIRYTIACVLLFAALAKAAMLATIPTLPVGGWFGLLEIRWVQIVAVEFELFWALLLIFNPFPRVIWFGTALLFVAFAVVSVAKWWLGEASCGCFGRVEVNPLYTAIFDVVVVGMLLLFRKHAVLSSESYSAGLRRLVPVIAIWCVFALGIYSWIADGEFQQLTEVGQVIDDGKTVQLQPDAWIGRELPIQKYIVLDGGILHGEFTIFLHRSSCDDCAKVLYQLEAGELSYRGQLVTIAILPQKRWYEFRTKTPLTKPHEGYLTPEIHWFVETPVVLTLDNNIVKRVRLREALTKGNNTGIR